MHSSSIVEHWRELAGAVHPSDQLVFETNPHTFNLDYPPPAYIGDIDNAPFVLLMMNGGYDPEKTPKEFPDEAAVARYIDMLHNPGPLVAGSISTYYETGRQGQFIVDGRLALVNAIPYRSGRLSQEKGNARLAEKLPSVHVHRKWLREELLPQALSGDRTIIAHRNAKWGLRRNEYQTPNIIFTRNPVSATLEQSVLDQIDL